MASGKQKAKAGVSGFVIVWIVLLIVGLMLAGIYAPRHTPVPAQQAKEARHALEVAEQNERVKAFYEQLARTP
jgi:hypothetical protein